MMDISIHKNYKETKFNTKNNSSLASLRLAAMMFISLISALSVRVNANEMATDTVCIAAQAQSRIDFRVNLTDFDTDYHGNDLRLEQMLSELDTMVLNPHVRIKRITILGTASPEGPYQKNVRLATGRANALASILKTRYSFPDSIYTVSIVPEYWDGLNRMLTKEVSAPDTELVLKLLGETDNLDMDEREYRLKSLSGGRPYSYIRKHILPYLRQASVTVDFESLRIRQYQEAISPECHTFNTIMSVSDILPIGISSAYYTSPRERFFSIKTNLLWDAILCANLGFEVELFPHWSLDVPVWYSPYDINKYWRIRLLAIQPEVRYWPKDAGIGHYFGIHTSVVGFNVSTGGKFRYQDSNHAAFGLGIDYGYAFHLDKAHRWSLEAQIGVGYINYRLAKYYNTGRNGAEVSHKSGLYWGVTRAGVTIAYKFYRERKERKWMRW